MPVNPPARSPIEDHVVAYFDRLYRPQLERLHGLVTATAHPADSRVAVSGPIHEKEGGFPRSRIGLVDAGGVRFLNTDGFSDSDPQWSPDGTSMTFLSDRGRAAGNFQLFLAKDGDPAAQSAGPVLEGEAVEAFAWSRDGRRILIQSADAGAEAAGSAATARIGSQEAEKPSWTPRVETGAHDGQWRRARIWNLADNTLTPVGHEGCNVWEAAWCGDDEIVAIVSDSPTEGGWYQTRIAIAPAGPGRFVTLASPDVELARVCASPDGKRIAVIEGRFHRTVGLGSVVIRDRDTGQATRPDVGAEVSILGWRDDDRLFFCGTRPPETVAGTLNVATGETSLQWRTSGTSGRKTPWAVTTTDGGMLLPCHAFDRPACLARVNAEGNERVILDLAHDGVNAIVAACGPARALQWKGRDGLDVLGWLITPPGVKRPPLVAFLHGGPSHLFRDSWTFDNPLVALLASAGYAVFLPNPRGSSGRSADFAARVLGDMAGEDMFDILAGVDHVLACHDVDADRLFITGGSYGGFMTCWLVSQTNRFAAACAIAPLTDMRSQFLTSHHPEFLSLYTGGATPYEVGGVFDQRSPLRHADKVATPTLVIAGERDNTTPSSQAVQFHRALILNGVPSHLVLYPEEGHAAARYEAQVDQGVRVLDWFRTYGGIDIDGARFGADQEN